MKKIHVNHVGITSLGKVVGLIQAIVGLVYGLVVTLVAIADVADAGASFLQGLGISLTVAVFAVVLFPLVGFVLGWIQGVVAAAILNVVFRESRGLELGIQEQK